MASSAQYAAVPLTLGALLSAANPNRDGTGTVVVLLPAQVTGVRVDDLAIVAKGTTTAGLVRIFFRKNTDVYLVREVIVTATVASATVPAFVTQLSNLAWVIEPGWEIIVSTEKAELFAVTVTRGGAL